MNPSETSTPLTGFNPEIYDRYSVPIYFEPYALDLFNRIDPAPLKSVLEIACGTGAVTRYLRKTLLPETKLVASDLSSDMLEYAKKKLQNEKIEWVIADACQLPFADDSFDLVVCQFGYMFAPDKPKAFREAYRVLRVGGSLLIATWDSIEFNEATQIVRGTFIKMFGGLPPESLLPFSMNDDHELKLLFEASGFKDISVEHVLKNAVAASAMDAATSAGRAGLMYNEIMKRNPSGLQKFIDTLFTEFKEEFGESPMIAQMQAVVCRGWKNRM